MPSASCDEDGVQSGCLAGIIWHWELAILSRYSVSQPARDLLCIMYLDWFQPPPSLFPAPHVPPFPTRRLLLTSAS